MATTTRITNVSVQRPRADAIRRVTFEIAASPGHHQGSLEVGDVGIIVGGAYVSADDLRAEAYAMLKLAREAEALADWLVTLAETHPSNHDERAAVGA